MYSIEEHKLFLSQPFLFVKSHIMIKVNLNQIMIDHHLSFQQFCYAQAKSLKFITQNYHFINYCLYTFSYIPVADLGEGL